VEAVNNTSARSTPSKPTRRFCGESTTPQTGAELGVWEKSLEDRAGIVSLWLLSYLNPLLALGSHKVLDEHDMGVPPNQDKADRAYAAALTAWNEQSEKCRKINEQRKSAYEQKLAMCRTEKRVKYHAPKYKEPSIAWSLVKAFGLPELVVGVIYYVISALMTFVPVMILSDLVRYFESGQRGYAHPWVEVVGLVVIPFLVSLLQTRHQAIYAHCAVFCRTAVSTLLYRKALRVSSAGRAVTSTGQVVNMMSNDTAQLQRFLQFVGMTVTAPIQIALALFLIYQQVCTLKFCELPYCFVEILRTYTMQ
jgi:ABC transporter transmembrane region